jgi:hypothetical protein
MNSGAKGFPMSAEQQINQEKFVCHNLLKIFRMIFHFKYWAEKLYNI